MEVNKLIGSQLHSVFFITPSAESHPSTLSIIKRALSESDSDGQILIANFFS
jgi:hypothetical protein